jgi:hypothetical protein
MEERIFHYRITPEVIKNDLFLVNYTGNSDTTNAEYVYCCDIYTSAVTKYFSGQTYAYSSMTQILSGGTFNTNTKQYNSILTGLTIPIFITENTTDIGIYTVFDGMVLQQETMTNFLFSATTTNPNTYYFYNTSDTEFKKYLSFSEYKVDWGDGSPTMTVNSVLPNNYSHTYVQQGQFTITMSGMSPWGVNLITKDVTVPYSTVTITNPKGIAHFIPAGGSWSGTPLSYDYIFSGDSVCDVELQTSGNFTTIPFKISGYTKSSINDLEVYGSKFDPTLFAGRFRLGVPITADTNTIGIFKGPSDDGLYTAYTINDINYFDYFDGTTVFIVESSGITSDMIVCSGITKNELLLNVIDEPVTQSDIFIERGKQSGLEALMRMGEVDNVGDLEKYGYGFFKVNEIQ